MAYTISDKLDWIMIFILEFGRKHGLTMKQAFNYLNRTKVWHSWISITTMYILSLSDQWLMI